MPRQKKKLNLGLYKLKKASESGDAHSQYLLGEHYRLMDLGGNEALAIRWFEKSAAQGYGLAQGRLGALQLIQIVAQHKDDVEAISRDKRIKKILLLLARATIKRSELAQKYLGLCFFNGWGLPINYRKALYCLEGLKDNYAQFYVGVIYEGVEGVKTNKKEALRYYQLSAKQGNEEAQERLKILLAEPKPRSQDLSFKRSEGAEDFKLLKKLHETPAYKKAPIKVQAAEEEELEETEEEDFYFGPTL